MMRNLLVAFSMFAMVKVTVLAPSMGFAADKNAGRLYFQGFMGHLHKSASDSSASMTAIQCAQSVELVEKEGVSVPDGWKYGRVGEDYGYVRSKFLGEKRPECFQQKYPKFYNALNLDLADFYYWGRLSDHFIEGESLAQ